MVYKSRYDEIKDFNWEIVHNEKDELYHIFLDGIHLCTVQNENDLNQDLLIQAVHYNVDY